jgi:hypothetical protein
MSSFTRAVFEPTGETREGRIVWRAVEAFRFDIGYLGSGLSIEVPAGFETDGPSIPWWLAPIARAGAMVRASAVHDRLREDLRFSKLEGDAIFLTALAAEGVSGLRRELAFMAVRLNGSRARAR